MEELSIEQKAKRYDEALKYTKIYYTNGDEDMKMMMKTCFPVLVEESEGEKIRKEIISALKFANHKGVYDKHLAWLEKQGEHAKFCDSIQVGDKVTRNKDGVLVNLSQLNRVAKKEEKQGEQKPADKVEPMFREGDWVVYCNDNVDLITGIEENGYRINNGGYIPFVCASDIKLWTIQDAKDGDVLACNEEILLFKSYSVQGLISLYCWYNGQTNNFHNKEVVDTLLTTRNKVCPATKEQRDTLERAMTNAGYRWDAEKKELKKIEQKPIEWHREDEQNLNACLGYISDEFLRRWLTDAIHVKYDKRDWSEEDEICYTSIMEHLKYSITNGKPETYTSGRLTDWINNRVKSLRPQNRWKPSKEQIMALRWVLNHIPYDSHKEEISGLLDQIKDL